MEEINIYCDESCHLEHDHINIMTLGAVYCHKNKIKQISKELSDIKEKNGFNKHSEIKWAKISNCNVNLYIDVINYFFDNPELYSRVYLCNKKTLDHQKYNQSHDDWYYKIYFRMLEFIFDREHRFNIYTDIKDVYSFDKCQKLWNICSNSQFDFKHDFIKKIQPIRSNEVQIIQIADIVIGAIGYANREFEPNHIHNKAKLKVIELIQNRSGYSLKKSTPYSEKKLNIYKWGWWD